MKSSTIKRLALSIAVSGTMATGPVMADTFNATAEVLNTITLTETTPLNFGTIFAVADADADDTTLATLVVSTAGAVSQGSATDGGGGTASNLVALGGHVAGLLTISGAAAFTDLTVTVGTGATLVSLIHSSGSPNVTPFTLDAIVTSPASGSTGQTDASGGLTILVGGTIGAEEGGTGTNFTSGYLDGTYTGSYDVSVSY